MTADAVERYRAPEYRRLFEAARRSLERTGGDLHASVGVPSPDEAERNAIIGLTGTYRRSGVKRVAIALRDLDAAVRSSTGLTLVDLLQKIGPELANRPADAARDTTAREEALDVARNSRLYETAEWFRTWLDGLTDDGTLTRLLGRQEATVVLNQSTKTLEYLESRPPERGPITLAVLAATITHDTKALNHGTSLSTLITRALAIRADTPKPTTAEGRRDLWDRFDVLLDDLASRVLVLNLPASGDGLGDWLTGAARLGIPFYATLHQIATLPIAVRCPLVHVCENPAVLRGAAGELGPNSLPLVCAEGRPSTAFHRLARAITAGGGELRYHGDFDWAGIAIASGIIDRHGARPWRMSAGDYRGALTREGERVKLAGRPLATPWDPELAQAMRDHGEAVYEEAVGAPLLADLHGTEESAGKCSPSKNMN